MYLLKSLKLMRLTFCLICVDGCNHLVDLFVVILEGSLKGGLDHFVIRLG